MAFTAVSTAPATLASRSAVPALALTLFTFTFAGQAVRNLLGWQGYAVVAAALFVVVLVMLWRHRTAVVRAGLPLALTAFLVVCALSLLWSDYEWATVLGVTTQWATAIAGLWLAAVADWPVIERALSRSMRLILASSLGFELFVTLVLERPLLPLYLDADSPPGAYYWSENHLPELGPIQGIVGNRNLLAFIALLSLVLTVASAAERRRLDRRAALWIAVALGTLALTRSATVVLALVAVAVVALLLLAIRRVPRHRRVAAYAAGWALLGMGMIASTASARGLLALLGRTDSSGRTTIWRTVVELAEQQPLLGWGWISYWAPWVPPYDGLIVIDGVEYLQAHNALLDIWLQLGVVGVAVALVTAALAALGAWRVATDGRGGLARTAVPLLLLTALLFQSLTESRLLIEGNWLLFVLLCSVLATAGGREATARRQAARTGRSSTLSP